MRRGEDVSDTDPRLAATQAALAAEHAAVYGYGLVGGRIGAEDGTQAREAYEAHLAARDRLRTAVRKLGGTPVAAAAAYALPFEVGDARAARRFAAELETRLAGAYADLVAATEGEARVAAATALGEAAVRAARWSGTAIAFPGLAEYANEESG